ncbi:MAG: hypothetical protein CBC35_03225 [Planctomycetes bacterium TMED75]|nr:hypothetical protein [Planctomycetaceae bacterium]OUU94911.1 MAG: hypothetical protein CBC35_03225 [Planctomycetes bacterium TMED75]
MPFQSHKSFLNPVRVACRAVPAETRRRNAAPPARRGLAVIWAVVFFILTLSFVGMGVEYAWLVEHQTRAQNAAEAASLAGAQALGTGRTVAAQFAVSTALLNPGSNEGVIVSGSDENLPGDIRFGHWDVENRTFTPNLLASNAIEITVQFNEDHPNGPVALIFGDLLGGSANVGARAVGHRRPLMPVPDRLWVVGPAAASLALREGGAILTKGACTIYSTESGAVLVDSGGVLDATLIDVVGTVSVDSFETIRGFLREGIDTSDQEEISPPPSYDQPDLEGLPERTAVIGFGGVRLKPGYYPEGIVINSGEYKLQNGLYRVGSPGIQISGTASLISANALIYLDPESDFVVDGCIAELQGPVVNQFGNDALDEWAGVAVLTQETDQGPAIVLKNNARLMTTGGIHAPGRTMEIDDSMANIGSLVLRELSVNDSTLTLGESEEHPHEHVLVQ